MSYAEFTLETVERQLGVTTQEADLFPGASVAAVPAWLVESLARATRLALISEKARSEFIVAPILMAARESGLGPCIAQMVAAQKFNESAARAATPIHGCVTTGETWQFLRLADSIALLDKSRYYLDNIKGILGVLKLTCDI